MLVALCALGCGCRDGQDFGTRRPAEGGDRCVAVLVVLGTALGCFSGPLTGGGESFCGVGVACDGGAFLNVAAV